MVTKINSEDLKKNTCISAQRIHKSDMFDDRNKQLLIDQPAMFDANKDPGKFVLGEFLIYQGMFVNCRRCRKQRAVMDG